MAVTVGLDIGSTGVRAAVIDTAKSRRTLRRYGELPLPHGAVVGGEIVDDLAVIETITALWRREKLPSRGVVVGTASQRVVVRHVDLPQMEDAELKRALPFHVQEAIPMPVEDAILDWVGVEDFVTDEGQPMRSILVIAAHREIVEALVSITRQAGITIQAIDLQAFALVRSVFGMEPALGNSLQGILDIGASITQLVIAKGGAARFVRLLPRGGDAFTVSLKDALEIEIADSDEMKRRVGVSSNGDTGGSDLDAEARAALTDQADSLIDEIRGSIEFYLSSSGEERISRLVVAGNGARLPHLARRLGRKLDIPVEPAKVLDFVDVGRVDKTDAEMLDAQPVLPAAVGLGLWGDI
jgi:type IV pilus assembly protein PilM